MSAKRNVGRSRSNKLAADEVGVSPVYKFRRLHSFFLGFLIACPVVYAVSRNSATAPLPHSAGNHSAERVSTNYPTLGELVQMSDDELRHWDIGFLNLRCAEVLPGAEQLDISRITATLDRWAEWVEHETKRHLYMFRKAPSEYDHSEGYFRMLMLITVLQQDLGVRYNPERIRDPDFKNSRDLFIHGLVGNSNGGTCVSMPVLYAAVARRLGYPVHLVLAKCHVFCRWEDTRERFNIEAAGLGMNKYDDTYYRSWPLPISDKEMERGIYLRNLTPAEELGLFLSARGCCLEDNGRLPEAYVAYAHAYQLSSGNPEHLVALKIAINKILVPLGRQEGALSSAASQLELPPRPSQLRAGAGLSGIGPTTPGPSTRILPSSRSLPFEAGKPVVPPINPTTAPSHDEKYHDDPILGPGGDSFP